MAIMIPSHGPRSNDSHGEVTTYELLKDQLSDEFTVIHSLPWLYSAVNDIDPRARPTGEVDFLVVHERLGVLVLEVKSGKYRIEKSEFVHIKTGAKSDPVQQTRRNIHGLTRWLGVDTALRLLVGYAYVFPHSDFSDNAISPALVDPSVDPPERIFINRVQMPTIGKHIQTLMTYWKQALNIPDLGSERREKLINTLCPDFDGSPDWADRVFYDERLWLRLTTEQNIVVNTAVSRDRMLISGWPGTGKTIMGIEIARRHLSAGKKALFVTFNTRLKDHIKSQFTENEACQVLTWHGLCSLAHKKSTGSTNTSNDDWYKADCNASLKTAILQQRMDDYDVLILDEAQALDIEWCRTLITWFKDKTIICFCDETQIFPFEPKTTNLEELRSLLGNIPAFSLSIVLRMPRAVTDHLINVMPPEQQLSSPREFEEETINEILTDQPFAKLLELHAALIKSGLRRKEILVLISSFQPAEFLQSLKTKNIDVEVVAKFRGLEAPAIIVYGAEEMDDSILFSAYSRATTTCYALFNIESLARKAKGAFQLSIVEKDLHKASIETAQLNAYTKNLLRTSTDANSLKLSSVELGWSADWCAWTIEFNTKSDDCATWMDYLLKEYHWPVFFWRSDSIRQVCYSKPVSGNDPWIKSDTLNLKHCQNCSSIKPFINKHYKKCIICANKSKHKGSLGAPRPEDFAKIADHDALLLKSLLPTSTHTLKNLPLSLAATGARLFAAKKNRRIKVLSMPLPPEWTSYRAALAFTQARIAIWPSDKDMDLREISRVLHEKFDALNALTLASWTQTITKAFEACAKKGFIEKTEDDKYRVIEDARILDR